MWNGRLLWFQYVVSVERRSMNADDYFSYRKWYYNPHDQESVHL